MKRLAYWQKLLYAAGSLGTALSYQAFATHIQFLYIDILGVSAAWIGRGWGLYGVWNAINDPLAGYWSDRTRSRWGRRKPWIALALIPMALFFWLLWVPPLSVLRGQAPLLVYFMVVVLIFDLLWTIVVMNWTALLPEMFTDEAERASASGWREFFSIFGLLVGVALPPLIVGAAWSGRGTMALLFALITVASFVLVLAGAREPRDAGEEQAPFGQALRMAVARAPFRWFLVANLFKEFIFSMLAASIQFWGKYVLKIQAPITLGGVALSIELQTSILLGLAFIMALPGLPLWTWAAKRYGAVRAWQLAQAAFAASTVLMFLAHDFYTGVLSTAFVGLTFGGLLMLPNLLVADIVDEDALVTGAQRSGMFFGVNGFVIRFAFTMQGLLLAALLGGSGYVRPTPEVLFPAQPASAELAIRSMMTVVPFLASLVVLFALSRYPLQGEPLAELRRQVEAAQARPAAGA